MWQNNGPSLWLDAKQQEVVKDGDPRAAFLLVGAGGQLTEEEARRWGLLSDKAKDEKAKEPPANKAKEPPANKGKQ